MYKVKFYDLSYIDALKSAWEELCVGVDMTYFQSFNWYKMLTMLNSNIKDKHFKIRLGIVYDDNEEVVLIAPLWIVTKTFKKYNKKGAYLFGRKQWSDYLNFIYKDINEEIIKALFCSLKDKYGIDKIYLEEIPTESQFFKMVTTNYSYVEHKLTTCVHLDLPSSIEEYNKILSKSFRQNIRTAINRTKKDDIKFLFNYDDKNVNIETFLNNRIDRLQEKKTKWTPSKYLRFKWFIKSLLTGDYWGEEYCFPEYIPITHDKNSKTMTCCTSDGELCAAFNYGFDANKKRIVLMAVCTNFKYYRYSPGIQLIYNYILEQMEKKEVACIDFTRGTERYKYDFGGQEHYNKYITITI